MSNARNIFSNLILGLFILVSFSILIVWVLLIKNDDASLINNISSFILQYFNDDLASQIDSSTLSDKINQLLPQLKVGTLILFIISILWITFWKYSENIFRSITSVSSPEIVDKIEISKVTIVIFSILALAIRLINFNQSLWLDEIVSAASYFGDVPFHKTLIATQFNNHIFYSIFAYFSGLPINFDWAYRIPSLIFGVLGIFAIAKLASQFNSRLVILFSIALITLSPLHIDQSQQARGYTLLVLCVIISSYIFLKLLSNPSRKYWIWFTVINIFGLWTHLYMVFTIVSQFIVFFICLLTSKLRKKSICTVNPSNTFLSFTIMGLMSIILYLPSLPYMLYSFFSDNAPNIVLEYNFLYTMLKALSVGEDGNGLAIVFFGLFILGLSQLYKVNRIFVIYIVVSFLLPLFIISITQPVFLYPRFFIFLLPLYIIATSFGIVFLVKIFPVKIRYIVVLISICLVILSNWNSIHKIITWDRQNYREASEVIKTYDSNNTVLAVLGYAENAISYYIPEYRIARVTDMDDVYQLTNQYDNVLFFISFNYNLDNEIVKFFHTERKVVSHHISRYGFVIVYKYII